MKHIDANAKLRVHSLMTPIAAAMCQEKIVPLKMFILG